MGNNQGCLNNCACQDTGCTGCMSKLGCSNGCMNRGSMDISDISLTDGSNTRLTPDEVRSILFSAGMTNVFLWNTDYVSVDVSQLRDFLREDGTNMFRYVPERTDCDDFSQIARGRISAQVIRSGSPYPPAIGEVQGNLRIDGKEVAHSMLFAIVHEKGKDRVALIEPQNDRWYDPHPENRYWCCTM